MKKNIKSWLILSSCFLLLIISIIFFIQSRQSTNQDQQSITLTDVGFDTPVTFQAQCSQEDFEKYTKILKQVFKENNKRFDQYNAYSGINNVYTINHQAGSQPVTVDDTTLDCIKLALQIHEICPKFDISYGNVMDVWHTYREEGMKLNEKGKDGKLPTDEEIQTALSHGGTDKIQINGNQISFTDPDTMIDLGGIAKGYTTQLAKKALNKAGLHNGFINAGGNVVLLGPKPDGSAWTIGIQDPDSQNSVVSFETDEDKTIVTSGDYQRYYTVDGKRYAHIIDPDTGYPANNCRSVTVITSDSGKADGLSTSLFCLDYEQGKALAKKEGVQAIWIFDKDHSPNETPNLKTKKYNIYMTKKIKKKVKLVTN